MKNKSLIKRFNDLADKSEKEGYKGDSAEYWFRGNVIELLIDLLNKFDGLNNQIKYLWQSIDQIEENKMQNNNDKKILD